MDSRGSVEARCWLRWHSGFGKESSRALSQARLAAKNSVFLQWNQRVRLAVVLAKAKQTGLARDQAKICLTTADAKKLRALSTSALYRLLVLSRAFGLTLEPKLSELAVALLPGDLRSRLQETSAHTRAP